MKISSVFWIKRNCQGLHEPLNKPIASLQAFYEKTTPQCPWNLPCVEQLCPTSDEARFRQPGVNPTKQLDFGCCFFEEILEIDFSEKKKNEYSICFKKKTTLPPVFMKTTSFSNKQHIYISQRLHPPSFRLPSDDAAQLAFGFGPREREATGLGIPKESMGFATPSWAMRKRAPGCCGII